MGAGRTFTTNSFGVLTTVNGTINNSGTVNGTATRLAFNAASIYNHTQNTGNIPTAAWNTTSNCNITGTTTTAPSGLIQSFAT